MGNMNSKAKKKKKRKKKKKKKKEKNGQVSSLQTWAFNPSDRHCGGDTHIQYGWSGGRVDTFLIHTYIQ